MTNVNTEAARRATGHQDVLLLPQHVAALADACDTSGGRGSVFANVMVERLAGPRALARLVATDSRSLVAATVPVGSGCAPGAGPVAGCAGDGGRTMVDGRAWKAAFALGLGPVAVSLSDGDVLVRREGDEPFTLDAGSINGTFSSVKSRIPQASPEGSIAIPIPALVKLLTILAEFAAGDPPTVRIALQGPEAPAVLWIDGGDRGTAVGLIMPHREPEGVREWGRAK